VDPVGLYPPTPNKHLKKITYKEDKAFSFLRWRNTQRRKEEEAK
jgi:hypothetical protein